MTVYEEPITRSEYEEKYNSIERAVESGAMSWRSGMSHVAVLTMIYAAQTTVTYRPGYGPLDDPNEPEVPFADNH